MLISHVRTHGNFTCDIIYGNLTCDIIYGSFTCDIIYGNFTCDIIYGNFTCYIFYSNFTCDIIYGNFTCDMVISHVTFFMVILHVTLFIVVLHVTLFISFSAEFCWMCLRNWTEHNREYYECSIYKENLQVVSENSGLKAREALKKYLFYYERVCAGKLGIKIKSYSLELIELSSINKVSLV